MSTEVASEGAVTATAPAAIQDEKVSVDEQSKGEEKVVGETKKDGEEEEKKEEEDGEKKEEEKKEVVTPRRSSRISATTHVVPTSNGTPAKGKRGGGGRAAKKRSAEDLEGVDSAADVKAKKVKKVNGTEEEGLKLGEPLPDLVLKNEQGEDVKVQNLAENKRGVVLFLVPKADTPGCTVQACGFRDSSSDFTSLEFEVYCVSADAPDKQKKWKDKKSLSFPLLSDPERTLIEKLTGGAKKTARSHFVFAGGKLVDRRLPVKAVDSPRLALEFIKALEISKTEAPAGVKEPDNADVAAANAATSAVVEPTESTPAADDANGHEATANGESAPATEAAAPAS